MEKYSRTVTTLASLWHDEARSTSLKTEVAQEVAMHIAATSSLPDAELWAYLAMEKKKAEAVITSSTANYEEWDKARIKQSAIGEIEHWFKKVEHIK